MIVTLKQAIKYGRPFRSKVQTNNPKAHSIKSGHIWRIGTLNGCKCMECEMEWSTDTLNFDVPDEWILDIDDDDSEFEEKAKNILSGMGIRVKEVAET